MLNQFRVSRFRAKSTMRGRRRNRRRVSTIEQLEARQLLIGSDWTNGLTPLNVDRDAGSIVSPIDALLIINELNSKKIQNPATGMLPPFTGPDTEPRPFIDVNCDQFVTPLDALLVINHLNGAQLPLGFAYSTSQGATGNFSILGCGPALREATRFETSLTTRLTIPAGAAAVSFVLEGVDFDTSSTGKIHDAFEASLLDLSGRALVHAIDPGRDGFYNASENATAIGTSQVLISGNRVTLSLADVLPGTVADLKFRLLNNDSDTGTAAAIRSVAFQSSFAGSQGFRSSATNAISNSPAPGLPANTFPSASSSLTTVSPPNSDVVLGRAPTDHSTSSSNQAGNGVGGSEGPSGTIIESRGTEFWVGFPDNLFEGANRPQKVLYISGDIATTGSVDIPGLIDPATSLPFHADFIVNPGVVTVVELPSLDVGDNADNETDFDVEVELVSQVQKKGIHVVANDPVAVYGLDLAVSTSDAFLALPVSSLGTEYINLGYENTFASISHVEGTQFLVVASQDNTQVQIAPGRYTGSTTTSNIAIKRPNGTVPFGLNNDNGNDIGPFVTDMAGTGSLEVSPPFVGYSGIFDFELIDLTTAAVPANLGDKVTLNFPTGREARVVSFDVVAGQRLYYDAINPNPAPNASVRILSPSGGDQGTLATQGDNNAVANLFGALQFRETGKYYVLVNGEQNAAFDFSFRLLDMDTAPKISLGAAVSGVNDPAGQAEVFRLDGVAGQVLAYDAFNDNRGVLFYVYGNGGQLVSVVTASDDHIIVLPETGTYTVILDSVSFVPSSHGFRLLDLKAQSTLALSTPTSVSFAGGNVQAFRLSGLAAQSLNLNIQSASNSGRTLISLYDPAGNEVALSNNGNPRAAKLMTNGEYYLLIRGVSIGDVGDLTFTANLVDDPVVAKSGLNTEQTLTIAAGASATYQFTAPAGTRVVIDSLDTANENLYVELNAPDGTRLYTGFGFAGELQDIPRYDPAFLPQSGTYNITLRSITVTDAGSYKFRVLDLDSFATPLSLDTLVSASFPTGRETLVYSFDATVGDQLLFDARSGSYIFGIYDPQLVATWGRGIFGAASLSEADGVSRILRTGRHYVIFHGDPGIPPDFSFQLKNLLATPSISLGVEVSGIVPGNGQVTYRVPLTSGQRIRFDTLLPYDSYNYVIYNSGGRVLYNSGFQNVDSGPPGGPFLVVAETGDYYVAVQSRQTAPQNYRFRIDDLASAPQLAFDTDLQVVLNPGNAAQVFRIDATAGESIQIDNFATFLPLNWGITGPLNQFVGGSNDGLDFTANILVSGTYYFTISGRQDSGPITVNFRASRTAGAAVPLTGFNTPVSLDVGLGETKTYSFSAPTGRFVYLNVRQSLFAIPTQTVTLNRGDTYLIRDSAGAGFSGAADVTGSIITSTKPVAVFGGNRATFIPSQFFAADHLVEQLPPTNTWGREFVSVPLATGSTRGDRFRFLAQADGTQVTVNDTLVATLDRGEFFEQVIVGSAHIVSNLPILVAQYAHSQNYYRTEPGANATFLGDPLMMIIPPLEQFLANYTVSTPVESSVLAAQRFDRNFINIVAPQEAVGQIELNGVPIAVSLFSAIENSGFFGAQVPVALGSYQLDGPLPFGAFVYGFGSFDSYGYVGGQSLSPVAQVGSVVLTPAIANRLVNDSLTFSATVADASGSPLAGIRVDFDVAGVNAQKSFGFSDANGQVQFSYVGIQIGRDVVTASVGQLLDDSIVDWSSNAAPPSLSVDAPLDGSSVPAGTTLVASGSAIADFPNATLDLVTVNGQPIENIDVAGSFFVSLFVGPGENEFEFTAIDSSNQVVSKIVTISGSQRDTTQVDFSQFSDVTGSFAVAYGRTSYNQDSRTLFAETAVKNSGQFPTDVPLLVGISNISDPSVLVRNAAGLTPDGIPYYDFTGLVTGGSLAPQSQTGILSSSFFNPNHTQFTYELVFYGKLNEAPQITSLPKTFADVGKLYQYSVSAVDANGDTLNYQLLESPPSMTIDGQTGRIAWTPSAADAGAQSISVQVSDGRGGIATQRFTLLTEVATNNRAPIFTSIPLVLAEVGIDYAYTAAAVDADEDGLTYRLVTKPAGMTINATSGKIDWRPTRAQLGHQVVEIEASDGKGGLSHQAFTLCVLTPADNHPPVFISTPPLAAMLGLFAYPTLALDGDGEALSYQLLTAPSGMTIDANSGLVNWQTTPANLGTHQVTIEVMDPRGGIDIQNFTMAVINNALPSFTSQPLTSASVGNSYSTQLSATDSDNDMLSFQLIDAPVGMVLDQAGALITWNVTSGAYEQERVTVRVNDGRGGSATQEFSILVTGGQSLGNNVNPLFTSVAPTAGSVGQSLIYVAKARDPNGDALTFDLPLAPAGMAIDPTSGAVAWTPTADQTGMQQVVLRAQDGLGGIWLQSFQIDVAGQNTAPVITSTPIATAAVGIPWEYRIWAQDADGNPLMFTLVSPSSGMTLARLDNSDASALLSFTPAAVGTIEVDLRVSDSRGGEFEQRFSIQVLASAANAAPVVTSTPRLTIPASQQWVYHLDASDPNANPLNFSLSQSPSGMSFDAGMRMLNWNPSLAQLGSHTVTMLVTDGQGGQVEQSFTVEVTANDLNHSPRIVSPPVAYNATIDEPLVYNLRAADDDHDPVQWRLLSAPRGASIDPIRGTLRWTPLPDQLGVQRFVVAATDPSGLEALQSFALTVSCANLPPLISTRAPNEATVEERFVYGVRAIDPEGDAVTFSLTSSPQGMTVDAERGIVRWTPSLNQLGTANVTLVATDARGNASTQTFQVNVTQTVRNAVPVITSKAVFRARVDAQYSYQVQARDPEGDAITYSLLAAPAGMQVNAAGLITWTPTVSQAGAHLIQVLAQDTAGGSAIQRFSVLARVNQGPVIQSQPPTSVSLGGTYRYDVAVNDPEGDAVSFALLVGPAGMSIDSRGRLSWQTSPGVELSNPISIEVSDAFGATTLQSYTLNVTPDQTAPNVVLQLSTNPLALGENAVVVVQATDDVGVVDLTLTMNGQPLVLSANQSVTVMGQTAGLFALQATARDASGNVGTADVQLRIFDPADTQGPTITITSPAPSSIATTLTDIVGSITDDNLQFYRIDYGRADLVDVNHPEADDPDYKTLTTSNTAAVDAVLATFDPTLLINDDYVLRILAQDLSGNVTAKTLPISLDGQLKLGQFSLDFTDLSIPVAGIPITVTRSYDTRNAGEQGDFGFGWTLSVSDPQIRESIPVNPLEEGGLFFAATPFREGTRVYLTNPEGRRVGFTFKPQGQFSIFGGGSFSATFVPDPGVYDQLDVGQLQLRKVNGAFYNGFFGDPFNPSAYRLTTKDGTVYTYGQFGGLDNIQDRNGNRIDIRPNGVFSSLGPSIEFIRDPQGRISQIIDPAGNSLNYEYDLVGNLISFADQVRNTTQYTYLDDPAHFLDTIIDPRNITVFATDFDADGRLVGTTDPFGNSITQAFDLDASLFSTTDSNGVITSVRYNERGNISQAIDGLGHSTVYEYNDPDFPDLVTRTVDRNGNATVSEYDRRGNLITETDATGGTFTAIYDSRNNLASIQNPLGNTSVIVFDSGSNLLSAINAQGDRGYVTYDAMARLVTSVDFNGNLTQFEYQGGCPCGAPSKTIYADGTYRVAEYNYFGQVTLEENYEANGKLAKRRQVFYDAFGREVRELIGDGSDPNNPATDERKFYASNLLAWEILVAPDSLSSTGTLLETPATAISQRKSRITEYEYDELGQLIQQTDPTGGVVEFRYDGNGNRVLLQDPVGNITTWTYDGSNRVAEERDPLYWTEYIAAHPATFAGLVGNAFLAAVVDANKLPSGASLANNQGALHVRSYDYDAEGNQTKIIDRNNRRREFTYDSGNRLLTERWYEANNGPLAETISFSYDLLGNMLTAADSDSNYAYTYNTLNQLVSVDNNPDGTRSVPHVILTYKYDSQGNQVLTRDNMGVIVASEYDALNRLAIRRWFDAEVPVGEQSDVEPARNDTVYSAAGGQFENRRYSDLDGTALVSRTIQTFDLAGRSDLLTHTNALGVVFSDYEYDYDFGGLLLREQRTHEDSQFSQTVDYRYDLTGQLVEAVFGTQDDEQYQYDANGNRVFSRRGDVELTYVTGPDNRLTSDGQFRYEYDGEGNLKLKIRLVDNETTEYFWDHHNRMVRIEQRSSGGIVLQEIEYRYDALDRRIMEIVNGLVTASTVYEGDNAWGDYNAAGLAEVRYLFSEQTDQIVAAHRTGDGIVWYYGDKQGTIVDLSDSSGVRIGTPTLYTSFGSPLDNATMADKAWNHYLFTGREFDALSDLYYYRSRFYSADTGNFLSNDPSSFEAGSFNLSAYVNNSPVNFTDPTGQVAIEYLSSLFWTTAFIGFGFNALVYAVGGYGDPASGAAISVLVCIDLGIVTAPFGPIVATWLGIACGVAGARLSQ